jgi:hypothetical protein
MRTMIFACAGTRPLERVRQIRDEIRVRVRSFLGAS